MLCSFCSYKLWSFVVQCAPLCTTDVLCGVFRERSQCTVSCKNIFKGHKDKLKKYLTESDLTWMNLIC